MTEDPSKSDCEHLNMPQSMPRGLLRHIIPRLLYRQEMTGTEIMQRLSNLTENQWNPSPGTIYPLLSSLEEDGVIEAATTDGRSKTYCLTEEGKKQMLNAITRMTSEVGQKTRLGPRIWEQLLEPDERMRFHLHGMHHSIESFHSVLDSLDKKQRKQLLQQLEKMADQLTSIIDKLRTGVS